MNDRFEIVEALSRYTEALEERDGEALAALFTPDGQLRLFSRYGREDHVPAGTDVVGRDALRAMVEKAALPPGAGMHYLTSDHVVEVTGDEARLRARFLVLRSTANARPDSGWPSDAELMQGTLSLFMIGFYDSHFARVEGKWLFTRHQIKHSLPMALGGEQR